jgi:hypothetical protein
MRQKTKNLIERKDAELNRGEEKGFIPSETVRLWGMAVIFLEVLDDIAAALEELVDRQ